MGDLRVLGMTSGIGSMLVGARQAGFRVIGNIEWRGYYHKKDELGRNTFLENFTGAFMVKKLIDLSEDQKDSIRGIDLIMGHPECGSYSQMNSAPKFHNKGDIPLFVDAMQELRPRYFVMDDLPKSFLAFSMAEYAERLPEYDLFPEWVSNYHYGNIQLNRRRMFMIGALKSERYAFSPGEEDHHVTVADLIGDLLGKEGAVENHDRHTDTEISGKATNYKFRGHRATWGDVIEWAKNQRSGTCFQYHSLDGTVKSRPGFCRGHWTGHAHVLDGGSPALHHLRCLPYSIRERARIQGFPDDFLFFGTRFLPDGTWDHEKNNGMVKQTGKAMPVQFCRYVSSQIAAHIRGESFSSPRQRMIKPDPYVNSAKRWFCENVGYADQDAACGSCWMSAKCDLPRCRRSSIPEASPFVVPPEKFQTARRRSPPRPAAQKNARPAYEYIQPTIIVETKP